MSGDDLKRNDQINLLEACKDYSDTGEWKGTFTYPNCGPDLVSQGLATEHGKITAAGKVALWLLGKGEDQTDSKSFQEVKLDLNQETKCKE